MTWKLLSFFTSVFRSGVTLFTCRRVRMKSVTPEQKNGCEKRKQFRSHYSKGSCFSFLQVWNFLREKKLGFGLVVLKCPIFDGRVLGFISKIDHRLFRPFGLFLPNKQLWGGGNVRFWFCLFIFIPYIYLIGFGPCVDGAPPFPLYQTSNRAQPSPRLGPQANQLKS